MKKKSGSQSAFFNPRVLIGFVFCLIGVVLAINAVMPSTPTTSLGANAPGDSLFVDKQARPPSGSAVAAARMPFAPAGVPDEWSIVTSPNTGTAPTTLYGTTCVSASDCWAVGYYWDGSNAHTLIEGSNGIVTSPNTSTTQDNILRSVTCVSATDCWAVGYYNNGTNVQTLIEQWNGTVWSIVNSPNTSTTQDNVLRSVTCASASECWAVGNYNSGTYSQTLIEQWTGTAWVIVTSPNYNGLTNSLTGVTCASATECFAVGDYLAGNFVYQTLIEQWTGTAWVIVTSPNTSTADINILNGVTCASASDCWAVGEYYVINVNHHTLVEHWNGNSWSIVNSPNTTTTEANILNGVTCVSASDCWAVGYYDKTSGGFMEPHVYQTLIEQWNGTSWAIVASPSTNRTQNNYLVSVVCASGLDCQAVGYYANLDSGDPYNHNLIEQWDGTSWAIVTAPSPSAEQDNILNRVTCVSASDCWAVGYYYAAIVQQTLIEHWDGISWAIVPSPNSGTADNYLNGVTCASATDCWAVGEYLVGGILEQTLIEHWDGNSWTIVSSPNRDPEAPNGLNAVTCVSATDCWAVGLGAISNLSDGTSMTLIEHWDGNSWTIVNSPNPPNTFVDNSLTGVTCTSGLNCWAAGHYNTGHYVGRFFVSGPDQTLIEHWDGTSWTIVASQNATQTTDNDLNAVTCASASDCWAVGYWNTPQRGFTLIEHWDGTSWNLVTYPPQGVELEDVTCVASDDCWAVGDYVQNSTSETLIERWDGTSWTIVTSPNIGGPNADYLRGVTCTSASDCWAVGDYIDVPRYSVSHTLTEHYTASPPPLTNAVSRMTHGTAGAFDINLPLTGNSGIECRSGRSAGNYQMVVPFQNPVTCNSAQVTSGTGSVSNFWVSVDGTQVTVNLTSVSNVQTIVVTLNVTDITGTYNLAVPMGVLAGDTNADRVVNSSDVSQTKAQSGNPVTNMNFREDVTVDGLINASDVLFVKSKVGTSLPTHP